MKYHKHLIDIGDVYYRKAHVTSFRYVFRSRNYMEFVPISTLMSYNAIFGHRAKRNIRNKWKAMFGSGEYEYTSWQGADE